MPLPNTTKAEGQGRLLQQLGMAHWQLRRPERLLGVCALSALRCGMVLLAEKPPPLRTPLLQDVLRLLRLTETQVIGMTPQQLTTIPNQALLWCLGTVIPSGARRYLASPPLAELSVNSIAKRQLWQQIAYYVDHCPATR